VRSTGRVLAWPAPSPRSGRPIRIGRTIAFRIVDPASKRSGCPAGSSAPQVNGSGKPVSRYAAVEGWPTQRGYTENITQSIESRRDLHALGDPCAFSRDASQGFVIGLTLHSNCLFRPTHGCLRKRFLAERTFEHGPRTCRSLPSQPSTSDRSQPIGRPRKRSFRGKWPTSERAVTNQRWRRVSRATSREVRISFQVGNRSLTQRERATSSGVTDRVIVRSPDLSMLMACGAHDLWFRLLRAELSLKREYGSIAQGCNGRNRRISGAYLKAGQGFYWLAREKRPGVASVQDVDATPCERRAYKEESSDAKG
jgi:hypothetical protein